ncbi:MAG: N-acetylneuraminate synthase family protein [Actinomycetota bacterium]|nr:N-acetylneuraminate synthase family protein [Actinomycetota bacterium]
MTNSDGRIYVIAEAAQGYEGDPTVAKLLVRAAAGSGADAVKFQIIFAEDLAQPGYKYFDLFTSLEMSADEWVDVRSLAGDLGLDFYVDVFGAKSVEVLRQLDANGAKLHSTSFFDEDLFATVAELCPVTLISIAGIYPEEVLRRAVTLNPASTILMYGIQAEPTPFQANNLNRIPELRARSSLQIGFMDHTDGGSSYANVPSLLALAMGVRVFEKHITISRCMEMEDYVSALSPDDFRGYVDLLQKAIAILGSSELQLTTDEVAYRERSLKRVVAGSEIAPGEALTTEKLALIRPTTPRGFHRFDDVIGRRAARAINVGEIIDKDSIL